MSLLCNIEIETCHVYIDTLMSYHMYTLYKDMHTRVYTYVESVQSRAPRGLVKIPVRKLELFHMSSPFVKY
jgi:hypothetical protein